MVVHSGLARPKRPNNERGRHRGLQFGVACKGGRQICAVPGGHAAGDEAGAVDRRMNAADPAATVAGATEDKACATEDKAGAAAEGVVGVVG
jgi:hypothetical protein